jgi:hypothetical protein
MPDAPAGEAAAAPRVESLRVWGIVRGRELAFDGALVLGPTALALAPAAASASPLVVRYADVDGARVGSAGLALYLHGGDVVELSSAPERAHELVTVAAEVTRRACALPELAHHLRGLGSQRARPGSDHDCFFAALLAARRTAEALASPVEQLRAFEAAVLRASTEQALADFAAARFPDSAPDRRALEAELDELAEPLWQQLAALERAREVAETSPDDSLFLSWRAWAAAVRAAYVAADRVWVAAIPALADSRGREGRLWRGVLWRRERGRR